MVRMSCGLEEPSISGSPALIRSPSCTPICLPLAIRYSRASPTSGVTTTLRLPLVSLPRQTAGDVLGLGGLARNLGDDVAGEHFRMLGDVDIRAHRQEVARHVLAMRQLKGLAVRVFDRDTRTHIELAIFHDDVGTRAGALVDALLHGLAFEDIAVLNRAADFGDDRRGVGIPLRDELGALDLVAVALAQFRSVNQWIALA